MGDLLCAQGVESKFPSVWERTPGKQYYRYPPVHPRNRKQATLRGAPKRILVGVSARTLGERQKHMFLCGWFQAIAKVWEHET